MLDHRVWPSITSPRAVPLIVLMMVATYSWANDTHTTEPRLAVPAIVVLRPDQFTLRILGGPSFFGALMTRNNLGYFRDMAAEIQQAHPAVGGCILFLRFGPRAVIFPYEERIETLPIRKIGDIHDVRNIYRPNRFQVREIAQGLSAHLTTQLSQGNVVEAHRASAAAFDNAVSGGPLVLSDIGTGRRAESVAPEGNKLMELAGKMSAVQQELHYLVALIFRIDQPLPLRTQEQDVFLRYLGMEGVKWESRGQFFGTAARRVRQVLVDQARKGQPLELFPLSGFSARDLQNVLRLDNALRQMEEFSPQSARIFELRFFAGLTERDVAEIVGSDVDTVKGRWSFALASLQRELE